MCCVMLEEVVVVVVRTRGVVERGQPLSLQVAQLQVKHIWDYYTSTPTFCLRGLSVLIILPDAHHG